MKKKSTQADWGKYWLSEEHQPQVIHQKLLKNLEAVINVKGKKILEIGAGMGGDSLYLAKKGAKVTLLDFSQEALDKIKASSQKEKIKIQTILADAKKMPFPDEAFDIVFHQGFLEHFRNPKVYLLEQKRILKKNGLLLIDVPQKFTTYTIKKRLQIWQKKWFAGWETEYSISELEELVKECGFKVLKSYGWGYYGRLHQLRHLKLGQWYQLLWKKIESSRLKLYLTFSIGLVGKKI